MFIYIKLYLKALQYFIKRKNYFAFNAIIKAILVFIVIFIIYK